MVFMFLGGVNFALHFLAWKRRDTGAYLSDPQFRGYLYLTLVLVIVVSFELYRSGVYASPVEALRNGAFAAISMQSTTGFAGAPFHMARDAAGSTDARHLRRWQCGIDRRRHESHPLAARVEAGAARLMRLVHPNAAMAVKFGDKAVEGRVLAAITGFFAMYLVLFGVMMLLMMVAGTDQADGVVGRRRVHQ
jgi:trk system potassium uptake protein TrkH